MGLSCFKSWKHDSTGHKGNRDVLASPGSYFFLSNSAGQGDEWLKSLNKGVWIPFTGVFGQRLEETVLYERRYGVRLVPLVVEQCVCFIRQHGLHEVGLFRQPGQTSLVKELQEAFDAGERPSFDSSTDVHTVASLLKLYLRQLPEPLVPHSCYQHFLLCGQKMSSDRTLGLVQLRNLLHELPVANFNLLNFICQFLNDVQSYSSSNKMSRQNLATVFGPNILRAKAEDPHSIIGGAALVQLLMLELIREHESLFSRFPPPGSARLPGGPRASPSVPRHPQLHPAPCLRQLSLPLIAERSQDAGQPAADQHNPDFISCAASNSVSQKKLLGHRYTSSQPENCFCPEPSSSYPLQHNMDYQHHADRGSSPGTSVQPEDLVPDVCKSRVELLSWAEAWTDLGEAGVHYWSSAAAEGGGEEAAIPDAASGDSSEAQAGSTRSVYDNMDRQSLHERMADITGGHFEANVTEKHGGVCKEREKGGEGEEPEHTGESSSSYSSCEVLPLDESSCQGDIVGGVSPVLSLRKQTTLASNQVSEHENNDDDEDDDGSDNDNKAVVDEDDDIFHPTSPASCSVPSLSPLSTGSSEVFLPSGPPDLQGPEARPQSADAPSLLAELQKQMARQKEEYQASIHRMERCNEVLQGQIAVLRVSLEQQKRSQSVAEIKIRNMEQAKADADLRNSTLQKEMELFFKMYGQIRGRGRNRDRILQSL
ncbi:rho GTPase-activating protein 24-like [Genypterus blacodes]|uniref:rho GTPase-activating protein 24-like n=1 Tax=Genypterus blacodes TaxID=154954 RepID=UPI003F75D992